MRSAPAARAILCTRRDALMPTMTTLTFDLDAGREHIELNQLLKLAGLCGSGGMGKQLVASGAVSVDGAVELRKTAKIRAGQVVTFEGVTVQVRAAP